MKTKKKVPLSFHNGWHNLFKKSLGASFVAWEQIGDDYFLKIIINKSPIYCEVGGTPNDVSAENYAGLLKDLLDGVKAKETENGQI